MSAAAQLPAIIMVCGLKLNRLLNLDVFCVPRLCTRLSRATRVVGRGAVDMPWATSELFSILASVLALTFAAAISGKNSSEKADMAASIARARARFEGFNLCNSAASLSNSLLMPAPPYLIHYLWMQLFLTDV